MLEGECRLKKNSELCVFLMYLYICKYGKRLISTEQLDFAEHLSQKCIVLSVGIDQGRILACGRKAMHILFVYNMPPMVLHVPENYPLNRNLLHLPCLALTLFSL